MHDPWSIGLLFFFLLNEEMWSNPATGLYKQSTHFVKPIVAIFMHSGWLGDMIFM